jgi:SP family general alpha glucoside:H+ symporter-like MFS transporter
MLKQGNMEGLVFEECFRGTNLRRTDVACIVWLIQAINALSGAYFFEQAGLSDILSFTFTLIRSIFVWYTFKLISHSVV